MTPPPLPYPETVDDVLARCAPVIEAEARAGFAGLRKFINRSTAQRARFQRERISNHGTINRRKRMTTTRIPLSKALSIPLAPFTGTKRLAAQGYDPDTGTLALTFRQGDATSPEYHYTFTPDQHDAFMKAEDKDAFFTTHIRPLDCMKVVPDSELEKAPA